MYSKVDAAPLLTDASALRAFGSVIDGIGSWMMQHNVGMTDRTARLFVAFVLLFLIAMGLVRSWPAVALGALGAYLGLSGTFGTCPLYALLDIDSHSRA